MVRDILQYFLDNIHKKRYNMFNKGTIKHKKGGYHAHQF